MGTGTIDFRRESVKKRPLKIELVPSSSFYISLRGILRPSDWRKISTETRNRARGTCRICGKHVGVRGLEAHEVWTYDEGTRTRSLAKIIPVCRSCHMSIHTGRAEIEGHLKEAAVHYAEVNGCTIEDFKKDLSDAYRVWQRRSKMIWKTEVGTWVKANGKEDILPACVAPDGIIDESVCPRCGKKLVRTRTLKGMMLGCPDEKCGYRRGLPVM